MKRETAVATAKEVVARLQSCRGVIDTPAASRPKVVVRELWLFGSTLKGAERPNDLDLLWSTELLGEYRMPGEGGAELDTVMNRRYGYVSAKDPFAEARRVLVGNRKMVRLHDKGIDGSVAYPRLLLFVA